MELRDGNNCHFVGNGGRTRMVTSLMHYAVSMPWTKSLLIVSCSTAPDNGKSWVPMRSWVSHWPAQSRCRSFKLSLYRSYLRGRVLEQRNLQATEGRSVRSRTVHTRR
jgi:hypothetical protein